MRNNKEMKKSFSEIVYSDFKNSLVYLKKIKPAFFFLVFLFLVSIALGYFFPAWFEDEVIKLIQELIKQTEGLGFFGLISFIMYNNIQSAFFALILGVFFGIVPLAVIIMNGYVLGFVSGKTVGVEGFSALWKLVPHGIFELPAIFISVSLGLRLGLFLFVYRGKNKKKELWKWFLDSFKVFILVVIPLLVIAAVIEGVLIKVLS